MLYKSLWASEFTSIGLPDVDWTQPMKSISYDWRQERQDGGDLQWPRHKGHKWQLLSHFHPHFSCDTVYLNITGWEPSFYGEKKKCYTQSSKRLDSASQLLSHSAAGDSIYPSANGPEVRGGTLSRLHCALSLRPHLVVVGVMLDDPTGINCTHKKCLSLHTNTHTDTEL